MYYGCFGLPNTERKMKINNNLYKKLVALVCIVIILVTILLVYYFNYVIIDIKYIDFDYKVRGPHYLGFNADTDALHFGIINQGGGGIRDLELTSPERARVLIKVIGADNISPNMNDFIIEPNQTTSIQFLAKVAPDTPLGNYSGKIRLVFRKV